MSNYSIMRLGDCCLSISDGDHMPPPKAERGIPFLTISDITTDNKLDFSNTMFVPKDYWDRIDEKRKPQKGDVLYSVTGSYGIPVYMDTHREFVFQRHIAILRPDPNFLDGEYLYYVLKNPSMLKRVEKLVTGAIQKTLGLESIRNIEIEVPPVNEQRQIVAILKDIDAKIDNNNAICADLEGMAKLLYDYWFVQFDFPDENGKPYKSSGGKMVWNEELQQEIPNGWEVFPFERCIQSINTGLNPRDNFKLNTGGHIRYLTVKNLTTNGTIDFSSCDFIDEKARAIVHRRSDISVGDILFASIAPLGRCFLIDEKPEDWDINESVFSIRPNYEHITSKFLYMTFMGNVFIKKATNSSTGSVFKGIRINDLMDMKTVVPTMSVLQDFDSKVEAIFSMKSNYTAESTSLASLRDFLLPMLMNGQVKVG